MGDVHSKLDEISLVVETAKAMPLSASCMVNRAELLAAVDELRDLLPVEMDAARRIVAERARVVADGQREADRIVAAAHLERNRLLAETDTGVGAGEEAERIVGQARDAAAAMRREIDAYVDTKLATFEVILSRTLGSVARGRAKIAGRTDFAALVDDEDQRDLVDERRYAGDGPAAASLASVAGPVGDPPDDEETSPEDPLPEDPLPEDGDGFVGAAPAEDDEGFVAPAGPGPGGVGWPGVPPRPDLADLVRAGRQVRAAGPID